MGDKRTGGSTTGDRGENRGLNLDETEGIAVVTDTFDDRWTEKGNEKAVVIRFDGKSYCTSVKEREALILTLRDGDVSEERVTL